MVSKVVVIALVAVIAAPILLGYAFNVDEVTETDYRTTGDGVNVTQLLQTGTDYTYTNATSYQLNTGFKEMQAPIFPFYEKYTTTKTSLELAYHEKPDGYIPGGPFTMTNYDQWAWLFIYNPTVGYLNAVLTDNNNQSTTVNRIHTLYHDYSDNTTYMTVYAAGTTDVSTTMRTFSNTATISFTTTGSYHADHTYQWYDRTVDNNYVDISAGFTFHYDQLSNPIYLGENYTNDSIQFPDSVRYAIITLDLDSITESNYSFGLGTKVYLEKTTTDGVVSWQAKPRPKISDNDFPVTDLYYDPNGNNTYQIKIWVDPNGQPYEGIPGYYEYTGHYEFRYVGNWPSFIGEANYYKTMSADYTFISLSPTFSSLQMGGFSNHSPIMRLDAAEYRAMEYSVISNKTYTPADFKTNPSTTINNPTVYGSSIVFGGNTYIVSKGNIKLGTHDIPVKGLVLSSVPNPDGGYDNKIGNTVISTTAQPSTIKFNGQWNASITTIAQESYTYTKTEWHAGEFGWDGIDHNFLMVGLITCLGVFIALGIYARKKGSGGLIPLMIVTGCAAAVFFIML